MSSKREASEALVPQFKPTQVLNIDQAGRRVILLGAVAEKPTILTMERSSFPNSLDIFCTLPTELRNVHVLGHNDIYSWYMANSPPIESAPDLKINVIHPCTEAHIKKYSQQTFRQITETPQIYREKIRPFMQQKREEGRLNWVFNILEGRTEQEDVLLRDESGSPEDTFLMLPDLYASICNVPWMSNSVRNWDRKTVSSLHLLGLVQRRDIWSIRDLKKQHVPWLTNMRDKLLKATVKLYPELEEDQLKFYMHYQPTYYHFHVHVVNVMLESGATQATGKAFGLENLISQLQTMSGDGDAGMADVDISYTLGEANELWQNVFLPLRTSPKTG